ncbi:MAG: S-layer homology domain-containing protein, partial [Oscillospiraceae bacterium]
MKKKLISLLLVLCMVTTLLPMSVMAVAFDDTSEHWAKTSIQHLADKNVVQGTLGKFRPDDTITRAEVAQIFDNLMDYQTATDKEYTDLTKDAWYAASMKKAAAAGVFAGGGDGTINPLGQMTRQEFFVTLARVLQLPDSTKVAPFSDSPNIADWARPKVNALVETGLLQGIKNADGSFAAKPLQTITRAEVITMLDRAFPGIYNSADTYTQPVTGNAVVSAPGVKLDGVTVSGDLFIAPGVANGEATLHNAKVAGRTMVYGGGKNSLILNGETALESLTAAKAALEDPLTIKLFDKATVKTITVVDGSAQTTVIVNAGATLDRLVIENPGTEVKGDGAVKVIVVTANNTVITVPNARIEVAAGVTGTMVGGKPVAGGTTVTSNSTGTGTKRPGGGNSDPVGPVQPENTWAVSFETNGGEKI